MIKTCQRVDASVENMGKLGKMAEHIYVATISLKETWNQQNDHNAFFHFHDSKSLHEK